MKSAVIKTPQFCPTAQWMRDLGIGKIAKTPFARVKAVNHPSYDTLLRLCQLERYKGRNDLHAMNNCRTLESDIAGHIQFSTIKAEDFEALPSQGLIANSPEMVRRGQ